MYTSDRNSKRTQGKMPVTIFDSRPLAAETLCATVLFVDLRGYTGLAEQLPPSRVVPLLVEFHGVLARATEMYGGQIYHMAGDGMMAGFGVRDPRHDGARDALAAGRMMLERFAPVARRWERELSVQTGIGIGLHLGDVALGFLGPPGRQATTLVGDTANVAARLCGRARAGEVLFSARVAAALGQDRPAPAPALGCVPYLQLAQFELRGRRTPLDIWCVPAADRLEI
jgi:adenylate cyclase